jgi:two-component system, chemotaxis family, chemotaxis protein CheV
MTLAELPVQARTAHDIPEPVEEQAAGAHGMEILLFSLGGTETFGINVFKVREVASTPHITRTPNVAAGVEGVIALRGSIIPVIDLARFVGADLESADRSGTLLVTELCGRTQGFLVGSADRIVRVDWDHVNPPSAALTGGEGPVTALTRLPDGRMVSILDLEQILAAAFGEPHVPALEPLAEQGSWSVLFADDSPVARRGISRVLENLGVRYQQATNGREAWDKLTTMAAQAHSEGAELRDRLRLILTDAEMPQMDGYVLTRRIKSDARFDGVPVVMHSALAARASGAAGADAFVGKFNPVGLADTLRPMLRERSRSRA